MKFAFLSLLTLTASMAMAASETSTSASFSDMDSGASVASSRAQALQTQSIYYSLPRTDMTYMELGAYAQSQNFHERSSSTGDVTRKFNNQAFFFNHSRGLTDLMAVDVGLDYFNRDSGDLNGATGLNLISAGVRSHFSAFDLNWVYGASVGYLPNVDSRDFDRKAVVSGQIGFEEAVDIAKWGVQTEWTTRDNELFQDQMNLIGFFEMPFLKQMSVGMSGGADLERVFSPQFEQSNFARIYGQYSWEKVSAVQFSLKQTNQKKGTVSVNDTETGLSLNRVF